MLDKTVAAVKKLIKDFRNIDARVERLEKIRPVSRDGRDGKDGISPDPDVIASDVLSKIPAPKDGRDGRDGKDGKDGVSPSASDIANIVLPKIPTPKDGVDGVSPDAEAIAQEVAAQMPAPRDGRDGKDGRKGDKGDRGPKGEPGRDGKSITDVKLRNNDLFVSIDGKQKKAGSINLPPPKSFVPGSGGGGANRSRPDAMGWHPDYKPGDTVKENTVVLDAGWLMISNKQTSERAAVQPTGTPFNVFDGTLVDNQVTAKKVITGNRYTFSEPGYINGYRVDTTVGNEYYIYLVEDPLGIKRITLLLSFVATENGFQEFGLNPRIIREGAQFDLIIFINEPDPTPTTFAGDWNYTTPNNPGIPAPGQMIHASKQADLISISIIDDAGGDRAAELGALSVGDLIEGAGLSWAIQGVADQGLYFDFAVTPALQGSPSGVQEFTFETVTATPITYGEDVNFWQSNPNVQGLFIADGAYEDIVPNETAYGTDILVQQALIPEDWDFMVASEPGSLTGGRKNVSLEEIGEFTTTATQAPTGLGDAGKIRISVGPGGDTTNGEFNIAPDGLITCNSNGIQYYFDLTVRVERSGSVGVSEIMGRFMYAPDGVEANAIQIGGTFAIRIDDTDTIWREQFEIRFSPAAGSVLWFELARNPGSNNSGQIGTTQPGGDISGWTPSNSVELSIGKLVTD